MAKDAVWLYHQFCLSFRDTEDLLAQRGIAVSYEATGDKAAPVTWREFYSALTLVWVFIMMAFSTTLFSGSRSPIRSPANLIYLAASFFMAMNYSVASWRGDVSHKRVVVAVLLAALALVVGAAAFFAGGTSK
jgi:hypothetical protein